MRTWPSFNSGRDFFSSLKVAFESEERIAFPVGLFWSVQVRVSVGGDMLLLFVIGVPEVVERYSSFILISNKNLQRMSVNYQAGVTRMRRKKSMLIVE